MPAADASSEPSADGQSIAPRFQVHAYPLVLRLATSGLQVLLAVNTLYVLTLIFFFTFTGAINPKPPGRALWFALLSFALFGLLWFIRWLTTASLFVEPERLVLERRGDRFEIPLASVEAVRVWRLLVPGAGLSLRMKSGRGFQYALRVADPQPVLEAMGRDSPRASAAARHPHTAFAHARSGLARRRWYFWGLKFVLFPLLPTGVMFRANQYITYGGPFEQYRMYGLGPYLQSFFTYWVYFTAVLVGVAGALRALFELVA
ncbi:hypothetical protein, partial [Archangium sp.]|uniref:hypothetical protein n=1 Tax=Archangium sp. TaxID=1872627 RepID=UPI002ED7A011